MRKNHDQVLLKTALHECYLSHGHYKKKLTSLPITKSLYGRKSWSRVVIQAVFLYDAIEFGLWT